jgi:hypothetical protein
MTRANVFATLVALTLIVLALALLPDLIRHL